MVFFLFNIIYVVLFFFVVCWGILLGLLNFVISFPIIYAVLLWAVLLSFFLSDLNIIIVLFVRSLDLVETPERSRYV